MNSFPGQKGFTLIEVFVALMVFALGILALYRLQVAMVQSNSFATELTRATALGEAKMERLMSLPYANADLTDTDGDGTNQDTSNPLDGTDDITANGTQFGLDHATSVTADHSETSGIYTTFWNIAVNQPVSSSKTIRVIVTWRDSRNQLHSLPIECIKGNQ